MRRSSLTGDRCQLLQPNAHSATGLNRTVAATPENDMTTTDIFVFGSNLLGIHGAGAAKVAATRYGAQRGIGSGHTGNAYAIPTKRRPTMNAADILPFDTIASYVADFLRYARLRPDLRFMVTRVGCGLAGFKDAEIAPRFADASKNVHLPLAWHTILFGAPVPDRVSFTE